MNLRNDIFEFLSDEICFLREEIVLKIILSGASLEIFLGRGVFFKLGHFDKHSSTSRKRKAPQEKASGFFA